MPSQTRRPSTIADAGTGGTLSWTNPSNAGATDGAYASVSFSGNEATSNWLYCSGFGVSSPTDATNRALVLYVVRKATVASRVLIDPYILFGGTVQNDSIGAGGYFTTSDATETHFSLDLSGYTPAQINGSGFGIALRVEFHNDFNTSDCIAYVDDIYFTYSYDGTDANPLVGTWSNVATLNASNSRTELQRPARIEAK